MSERYWVESKEARFSCAVPFGSLAAAIAEAERRIADGAFSASVYALREGEYSGEKVWGR